jgi:hypothetical protein
MSKKRKRNLQFKIDEYEIVSRMKKGQIRATCFIKVTNERLTRLDISLIVVTSNIFSISKVPERKNKVWMRFLIYLSSLNDRQKRNATNFIERKELS